MSSQAPPSSTSTEEKRFKINPGDKAWILHETECYRLVTVKEQLNNEFTVFDEDYKSWKVKEGEIWPVNPPSMEGVPDNTQLMHLHDPSLLHNLRTRYQRDEIYTYTAYILIAVNPYKQLSIYDDSIIKNYFGKSIGILPPHVYAIADRAYRNMKNTGKNQSIVVSGESGAGKTETCKFVMRFFAVVASSAGSNKLDQLETKILESNPLLESFGNAKTLRNNNSSRFGKYTQLHFNAFSQVVGASIVTYLLEKSRLIAQAKGERNFHIFYQLLAGATEEERKEWKLSKADDYFYLNQSGCTTIENVDDGKDFGNIRKFLLSIGVDPQTQNKLFRVLSGLLHLGNITFSVVTEKKDKKKGEEGNIDDKVHVSEQSLHSLETAAALFGIQKELLQERLVNRTITAGGKGKSSENTYIIRLNEQEATYARDALAKYVYGHVFDWLVATINKNIPRGDSKTYIGILDISGFEIFENNSFEQFSINFANERIQQYFNHQILSQEQEIYLLEGLQWRKVEYVDNQEVINLVDSKRTGIFDLLDEECIMPKGSDKSFTAKIHTTHSANDHLEIPKYSKKSKGKRLNKDEGFVVKHFAGSVIYTSQNFLDKNNDTIHQDLIDLLYISNDSYFKGLFPVSENEDEYIPTANRRFKSVSARFREQLNGLMNDLYSTTSHFIRCIKPNEMQKPGIFDNISVMTQLRYNGMCTALELMQAGFPTRIGFDELHARYSPLMPAVFAKLKPITFCEAVLVALDLHGGRDFQMGLTKVFFRAGKLQFLDELTNNSKDAMESIVGKVKRWLARKRFRSAIASVKSINRLGKQIEVLRSMYELRKVGRFALKMARLWIPHITKSRQALLASEEYKRRMEEEARRKEEARLALIRKKEEEERLRREKKEANLRAREEAKRLLESQRDKAEEGKKHAEEHAKELAQKLKIVEEEKHQSLQKNQQLELNVRQLEEQVQDLKNTFVKQESDTETMISNLKAQIYELENKLMNQQNINQQLERKNTELSNDLKEEQSKLETCKQENALQREINKKAEEEINSLNRWLEETTDSYKREQELTAKLRQDLSEETTQRIEENRKAALHLEQVQMKATNDLLTKQAEYDNLLAAKKQVEADMAKQKVEMTVVNLDLSSKLEFMTKDRDNWKAKYEDLEAKYNEALKKIDTYEKERDKLIQTALNAQSDQRKLKQIIDKFEKQPEGYLKLLYGDVYFNTLVKEKECIKHGEVMKQGGPNKNKWQKRYLLLIENHLLYYASPQDKEPRGVIRITPDNTASSKADLKKLKIDHSFTVVKSGRAYYFSCPNEEEVSQWLREILLAQGWNVEEVETYLEANFKNAHTLRSIKGRLVIDD